MEETKNAALHWLNQGVATIPLIYKTKAPAIKWTPYKTKLPTEQQIELWYQYPKNIAVICGWQNLVILDFDNPENYAAWFVWFLEHDRQVTETYRTQTNRGIHAYFFLTEPIKVNSIRSALFEVKANGKLTTIPPSVHQSGRVYASLDDPSNVQTISLDRILNYSPVSLHPPIAFPTRSKYAPVIDTSRESSIEAIRANVSILSFFPSAQPIDAEKRFYRTSCPLHGKSSNFWIDTKLGICSCWAGCFVKPVDIIGLYQAMNNCDIKTAIQDLERFL